MSADPAYRKIIHIDMDAFFASVEQRDNPDYRGKPIVVGGSPTGRGVVAAASYDARKYGVRSAMPSHRALQLCPQLIFVRPRFDVYREVSDAIREIFSRYTDLIEPLSIDEAYLDVSDDKLGIGSAMTIAQEIRQAIRNELHLTASAGISINKFVAKVASDLNKPDGITFIGPSRIEKFMESLPVEKFYGVGKVTAAKMKELSWHTGGDLKKLSEAELVRHFGKQGHFYFNIVRGIDNRPVQPFRERKSVGVEDTFEEDLTLAADLNRELEKLADKLCDRTQRRELKGRTLTLKIRFSDFSSITRSRSFPAPINDRTLILKTACELLFREIPEGDRKIRLLGITLSNFHETKPQGTDPMQLSLF
jgi:DNA polymerase-4